MDYSLALTVAAECIIDDDKAILIHWLLLHLHILNFLPTLVTQATAPLRYCENPTDKAKASLLKNDKWNDRPIDMSFTRSTPHLLKC